MKKKIIVPGICMAIFIVCLFLLFNYNCNSRPMNKLITVNVEALTDSEGSSNYNICYSESVVKKGYTYYDCAKCNEKVYDEKGKGTYSKCYY